jgi:hypothetical protein
LLIIAGAVLLGLMGQQRLDAAPITSMDGVIGDFTLSAVGGSGAATLTINNLTVATSKLNGTAPM